MKKAAEILFAFVVLIVAFALVSWMTGPKITTVEGTKTALVDLPTKDWQRVCFSPAYHAENSNACRSSIRVPEGWSYVTFYSQGGTCERFRFHADFLVKHGADYRCFSKEESKDIQIVVENGVLTLR